MLNEMHLTVQEETIDKYAFWVSFNLDIFFGATSQHCEPKKISVRKTQKPQRFLGFFVSFFKVEF